MFTKEILTRNEHTTDKSASEFSKTNSLATSTQFQSIANPSNVLRSVSLEASLSDEDF